MRTNVLYYGDNLVWLKDHDYFPNESIDLIYLDPPFNSNADYNVIFNEPGGEESQAPILEKPIYLYEVDIGIEETILVPEEMLKQIEGQKEV